MKTKSIVGSLAALALLVGAGCESHEHHLRARATISKIDAQQIALEKAPGGTVQEGELGKEHGGWVVQFAWDRNDADDLARTVAADVRNRICLLGPRRAPPYVGGYKWKFKTWRRVKIFRVRRDDRC